MKPIKILHVKNRTDRIDEISDEYEDKFNIYHLNPTFESFKNELNLWHPDAILTKPLDSLKRDIEYKDIEYGRMLGFYINEVQFVVYELEGSNNVVVESEYESIVLTTTLLHNNLNVWKSFKFSFQIDRIIKKVTSDELNYNVEYAYYSNERYMLCIKMDDKFGDIMNFRFDDGRLFFEGVSYPDIEVWYPSNKIVDLDTKIKRLNEKKEFYQNVRRDIEKLLDIG